MTYDNTKLEFALTQWLNDPHQVQHGVEYEHYSREMMEAFVGYCLLHRLMKRSPGSVVFGQAMNRRGFASVSRLCRTFYQGLRLNPEMELPEVIMPQRVRKKMNDAEAKRQLRAKVAAESRLSDDVREERKRHVLEEMRMETATVIRNVEPTGFFGE